MASGGKCGVKPHAIKGEYPLKKKDMKPSAPSIEVMLERVVTFQVSEDLRYAFKRSKQTFTFDGNSANP